MLVDATLQVSTAQALTGAASASEDYVDLKHAHSIGEGEPLALVVHINVAAGGTTPTLAISVQVDDNTSFSSATTIASGPVLAEAALVAGARFVVVLPPWGGLVTSDPAAAEYRYLRAYYTTGGTTPTMTVTAEFTKLNMIPTWRAYADNVTIS
jgi:hypothetical protein